MKGDSWDILLIRTQKHLKTRVCTIQYNSSSEFSSKDPFSHRANPHATSIGQIFQISLEWPRYSCDLNLLNFNLWFIWGGKSSQNFSEVFVDSRVQPNPEDLQPFAKYFPKHLHLYIKAKWRYFEENRFFYFF